MVSHVRHAAPAVSPAVAAATTCARSDDPAAPLLLLERDVDLHDGLRDILSSLYDQYRNEGSVSRGTRNIAPNLFVGSSRRGYFNYGRSANAILVYAYTGPASCFAEVAEEMLAHCRRHGLQLNFFTDAPVSDIAGVSFSATPFGILQRINDIKSFSLEGGAMRRLRYQVGKFEKAGACDTREYACGTDPLVDREIASIIDRWCEARPMVNPLIHIVRQEILAGSLHPQHRIFLTRLDGVLQNVILISKMSGELNGYLMDLEFYPREMPLGGLEFAIVRIIETLAAEGCDLLSLGGTYGVRLEASEHADPAVDAVLDALHSQGIFNDEGNLQFKNKFRPENRTIYLCRPVVDSAADNVLDLIMMIADPDRQSSDAEHHAVPRANDGAEPAMSPPRESKAQDVLSPQHSPRLHALEAAGFNPMNLSSADVDHDLKTDSWAQLDFPAQASMMARLRAQLQHPVDVSSAIAEVFPFRHFILTDSGRSAEHVMCKAWPRRGRVPQNLLFPTGLYHLLDKGFEPVEIIHPALLAGQDVPDRAGIDLDALRSLLTADASAIAFVCIEVADNAAGGSAVSNEHLRAVRELLAPHRIPLVIDATRVVENAMQLIDQRVEDAGRKTWDVVRETLKLGDVVYASLCKDFCIDRGGIIATDDADLAERFQRILDEDGGGLDVIERRLVALALRQAGQIESRCRRRMESARGLWEALRAEGLPVLSPVGGHCVLVDVLAMPVFSALPHPVPSFVAWLYLATGIRAGAHSVGMQSGTRLNGCVRLALPVGLEPAEVDDLVARLIRAVREMRDVPELAPVSGIPTVGDLHAAHAVSRWHRSTTAAVTDPVAARTAESVVVQDAVNADATVMGAQSFHKDVPVAAMETGSMSMHAEPAARRARNEQEIAVVGIGGRYPGAHGVVEFWELLRDGRDAITDLPQERLDKRLKHPFTRSYRGGFIDAIDRFDSLFFNISPREAEVLDPQERLFLEVAWETLEDAGYHPDMLAQDPASRDVGVFVGAVWAMYQMVGAEQKLVGRDLNSNSFLWSISNRVSYWMNFSGPSMTVDTACSSSLTALHLACEAIRNGDCSSAIVGGVNLDLHQHKFDINHGGGALSPDGLCRAFGEGANGYVAGEGVGALYLKPLSRAIEDRDQIYGLIRGTMVNHGGRTSGYTVPNPKAQGDLVAAALARSGVDARTIGYIEAHGTGTELGDPIEIAGLASAFERDAVPMGSCPIGSVKTNIGHLEAAAGVVGVTKALLQIRHRQLVPSLHSARPNPHIDFAETPFVVQQSLAPWAAKTLDGRILPLRAGISSFGAGGANAHVMVESFDGLPVQEHAHAGEYVFPLSARTEEQLREMARRLRDDLQRDPQRDAADIAFTLQEGRRSFEHRMAIVAASVRGLISALSAFIDGRSDAAVLVGNAKNADGVTRLLGREEKTQFIALLAQSRDPRRLAQLWIDGLLSDCRGFLSVGRRISLPTYPFADKRHWIAPAHASDATIGARPGLHPLLDSNESTFQRQLFRKSFRASEFVLADHRVSGVPTLPGTAYLEMARIAGELATGRKVRRIRNITWISPLSAEGEAVTEAIVELRPVSGDAMFEVFAEDGAGQRRLFAQGKLVFSAEDPATAEDARIDVSEILGRSRKVLDRAAAYPLFETVGMSYGESFQLLQDVYRDGDSILGRLRVPDARMADFDAFVFHPCILDASMQAGVAGQLGDATGEMKVPYSIGEVEILHPLTRNCYSHVVKSEQRSQGSVSREHVTITDETGRVLARIRDAVGVALTAVHDKAPQAAATSASGPAAHAGQGADEVFEELRYVRAWKAGQKASAHAPRHLLLFDTDGHRAAHARARGVTTVLVLPGDTFDASADDTLRIDPREPSHAARLFDVLEERGIEPEDIAFAWNDAEAPDSPAALQSILDNGVLAFLHLVRAVVERKGTTRRTRIAYAWSVPEHVSAPQHEAIAGFIRTLRLEHPKCDAKAVELRGMAADAGMDALLAEFDPALQDDIVVRHGPQGREVRGLQPLAQDDSNQAAGQDAIFKEGGVYLITGGAGGLGMVFAEHLARTCKAKLVLVGRSPLSEALRERLDGLRALGAEPLYVAADVGQEAGAAQAVAAARDAFGRVHGIVHAAGTLRDSYLRKKTVAEMNDVFAPKVFGTCHLDALTRDDDLDFFVLFSSLAAVGGNAGQCDYAFANHYMDAFAEQRERQRAAGLRRGRTLSINWSLWAEGGMRLDEQTELFFRRTLGILPLETHVGLAALSSGLRTQEAQIAVLQGQRDKIELAWGLAKKPAVVGEAASAPVATTASAADGELRGKVVGSLSAIVMDMLKLSADDLSLDAILLDLGFDSIGLTTFANAINERYGLDINPVLFFEYPSINAISDVLVTEHADAVSAAHVTAGGPNKPAQAAAVAATKTAPVESSRGHELQSTGIDKGWSDGPHRTIQPTPAASAGTGGDFSRDRRFRDVPIAIVGMAGVMPQSDNVEAFWENLRDARNLVTEIPRDRWIWEEYDGNPVKEVNKSNSRWGGFLREVDKFDPLFFGITPREAEMMDPQQRIFIETVWSAIEDSGHKVSDLSGTRTGLFVGVSAKDYIDILAENQSSLDGFSASGNSHSILANRVSFLLNLRGPSAPLDTACSSSLIALHRAIESIHTGSCDMAIVGGVQVMLTPVGHISLSSAGMLSVDGKCKTFDKDANGYVRGEGSGAIFIKTLADALRDGNPIHAVVRATAENHGGRVTMLTAPNPKAQAELLFEAYEKGEVDPTTVGYIECHGTGTSLGDPIEIQALKKSFSDLYRKRGATPPVKPHCGLSSVKTNIGHLEPAAGIASLLKTLMAIRHRQIPALLHFETLNPYIDLDGSPFYIADRTTDWAAPRAADGTELPRIAGVSSFGWGGANAHVVLEEYRRPARIEPARETLPVVLSARNEARLKDYARVLLAHLRKHPELPFADLAYTLQVGRDPMEERLAVLAASTAELAGKLEGFLGGETRVEGVHRGKVSRYKRNDQGLSVLGGDDDVAARIPGWLKDRSHAQLATAWVDGAEVDWRILHATETASSPRRISLPTYPFARDRHWIEIKSTSRPGTAAVLHPLVHANTSTLDRHRYTTRFSGKELLLADHARTLPPAACMDIARTSIALANGATRDPADVVLTDMTWYEPCVANGAPLHVDVRPGRGGSITCEIYSQDDAAVMPRVTHAMVTAHHSAGTASKLDVHHLRALLREGQFDGARLDAAVDGLAPVRGPSLRSIREFHLGHRQALARLVPGMNDQGTTDGLHLPILLDGALQAAAILAGTANPPSSLTALRQFAPCAGEAYAWIRLGTGAETGQVRVDMDLIDSEGTIFMRMEGLAFDVPETIVAENDTAATEDFAAMLDALYRPAAVPGTTSPETADAAKAAFEKMLEEIL
ncbi:MAG: SDR family NAD(P)-dependent oxidoreductase [Xanthomonadaceae bacterium]|nr:SDR family NAD(P)-dependent oxidoreductase [Xanthomonadaceae bacterium]